jgi:hypothetical protein
MSLKMEAACSSEMLMYSHKTTQRNNSEDHDVKSHRFENFRSYFFVLKKK